jgi:hypothetical protein
MLSITSSGSFDKTKAFLASIARVNPMRVMESCGQEGVIALEAATPVRTGLTASSWYYKVSDRNGIYTISWFNSDVENGFPVAIMLQYGYGTGTGGYVQGQDYINPALKPIFDKIADRVWKAVTSS